jgi:hypothetical protein
MARQPPELRTALRLEPDDGTAHLLGNRDRCFSAHGSHADPTPERARTLSGLVARRGQAGAVARSAANCSW